MRRNGIGGRAILALAIAGGLAPRAARAVSITEYAIGFYAGLNQITAGPDGRVWFCEFGADKIGAITTGVNGSLGNLSHYPIRASSGCSGIETANGLLYYSEVNAGKLGAMSTIGAWIDGGPYSQPGGVAHGADGSLWVAEFGSHSAGTIPLFNGAPLAQTLPMPTATGRPEQVALGPDDSMWLTEPNVDKVAVCVPGGSCVEYSFPAGSHPLGIVAGSDGNVWVTENSASTIARVTPAGVITHYPLPTAAAKPWGIAAGTDGALWFVEYAGNKVGRITTAGAITEFPLPTSNAGAQWITSGPDGNLWFTEELLDRIGRLVRSLPGDVNGDGAVAVSDVFYLINFLFAGGAAPK